MGMKSALSAHYFEIKNAILSLLTEHPESNLVIAGHSLGGGYATILYLMVCNRFFLQLLKTRSYN